MLRPALAALLVALALAPSPALADEAKDLVGKYQCTFTSDGFKYPPFPCVISQAKDGLRLEKTAGSQRIRGAATPTADGFRFAGEFHCPWGACDEKTEGEFKRVGKGEYEGTLRPSGILVRLKRGR